MIGVCIGLLLMLSFTGLLDGIEQETFIAAHGLDQDAVQIAEGHLRIQRDCALFREVPLVDRQSIEVNWFEGWGQSSGSEHVSMQAVLRQAHALAEAAGGGRCRAGGGAGAVVFSSLVADMCTEPDGSLAIPFGRLRDVLGAQYRRRLVSISMAQAWMPPAMLTALS